MILPENRAFSASNIPLKADDYHGRANYVRTQPNVAEKGVESINLEMIFEEAVRFAMAVRSCVIQLN